MKKRQLYLTGLCTVSFFFIYIIARSEAQQWSDLIYEVKPYGYVDRIWIWPKYEISLCWREAYSQWSNEKAMASQAVNELIEHNSPYKLNGWHSICDASTVARIEITVEQGAPPCSCIGRQRFKDILGTVRERTTLMHLNFSDYCPKNKYINFCLKTVAVHEFMHELGFLHEHLRPEVNSRNPKCMERYAQQIIDERSGLVLPLALYDYDDKSIMNYCAYPERYRLAPMLSGEDIKSLDAISEITRMKISGEDLDLPNFNQRCSL